MLYQKDGPFRKISTLYTVFCILFPAFLFLINTSSLSASEGRLRTTLAFRRSVGAKEALELTTDLPIRRSIGAKEGLPQALLTLKPLNPLKQVQGQGQGTEGQAGWAATYGGGDNEHAASIHQTTDGGYIVAGSTESFGAGDQDVWVLKLRPDGSVEWQKAYGGAGLDRAFSIQQTSDGGYIVVGETRSFGAGAFDFWVLKLGPDGSVEWQKTYGGGGWDFAQSIQQTTDGGYIVAGNTDSFGVKGLWVLKLRPDGSVEWQKVYGEVDMLYWAESVHQTAAGGYIVAGRILPFVPEDPDLLVLKLGPDGSVEWQKACRGAYYDRADSIQQTTDGGYIVAGNTDSFGVKGLWVLKLRPDGTVEWQKAYGGILSLADVIYSIQQTRDGGYVVAGVSDCFGVDHGDIWVLKLKPNGSVEWQKAYLGEDYDSALSIQQTTDGGYIVAGYTRSFCAGAPPDLLVLKLDAHGSINPSCAFIVVDTYSSEISSDARVLDTRASVRDSNINPRDSWATVQDTKASANILCP